MRKIIFLSCLFVFLSAKEIAQPWSTGSAYVTPHHRWEIGLFQPLKYGLAPGLEVATHPLAMAVIPNLTIKRTLNLPATGVWATVHSLTYPTPLMNMLAREGTGGLVSPEFEFPAAVIFYNEIRVSRTIKKNILMTSKVGLALGKTFGDLDNRTTIDFPLIFQRLSPLYDGAYLRIGADLEFKKLNIFGWRLSDRWQLLLDDDLFLIAGKEHRIGLEHKGLLIWNKTEKFRFTVGYKIVFGQYPFGTQWNIMPPHIQLLPVWLPLFDIQWAW